MATPHGSCQQCRWGPLRYLDHDEGSEARQELQDVVRSSQVLDQAKVDVCSDEVLLSSVLGRAYIIRRIPTESSMQRC